MRHASQDALYEANLGPLQPKNGIYPWPIQHGGTFIEIAQRAWAEPERLLELSTRLAHKTQLLESEDPNDFLHQFCKLEVRTLNW